MKKTALVMFLLSCMKINGLFASENDYTKQIQLIKKHVYTDYRGMYRKASGNLKFPYIVPGSKQYQKTLWDWDSWLSNVALRQILQDIGSEKDKKEALQYEQGCVLNFLEFGGLDGWIPIWIFDNSTRGDLRPHELYATNMHKPCLAQHAAFITKVSNGDAEWLREKFYYLQTFINNYLGHHRHESGLFFWQDDAAIGVDNDPCTFFRPPRSSGSIYLNTLMYKELLAMSYLATKLHLNDIATTYSKEAQSLKKAIQENCWDDWLGFYYSVDFNLMPRQKEKTWTKHSGLPRTYDNLIMRIGVWSGFLAMWAEIATPQQAERMVKEHFKDTATFNSAFGIRTLSKKEKMYDIRATGNPSSWTGPIWGVSNYLVFQGLLNYGFEKEAEDLAHKTITLFGQDYRRFGALHEYYQPDNGEPVLNKGFQNWNYLVMNMIAWLEKRERVEEF